MASRRLADPLVSNRDAQMALPLEVLADLRLAVDREDIDIQASGDRVVVDLPSLRAGRRLLAAHPVSRAQGAATDRIHEALTVAGITADVRLRGDIVARIGAEADPGRLGRLLNQGAVEVRAAPSLRAAARDRPVVTALVIGGLLFLISWLVARAWRA